MVPHSLQTVAYALIILIAAGFILIIGKTFLIPIALAILFSFLLFPITNWLEQHKIARILANIIALVCTVIVIIGITIGISLLTKSFVADLPTMRENMTTNVQQTYTWVENTFSVSTVQQKIWIEENLRIETILSDDNLRSIFTTTTTSFLTIGLMFIYTFFFLYYRNKFGDLLFKLIPDSKHKRFHKITDELTSITPHYLTGLVVVVVILAILNSVGFAIIGVANPIFFGVLAAILNIVPYIGTIIGFGFVFLVTLATQNVSVALWIIPVFLVVQFFENNILTPNITARQVDLNPLVAIIGITLAGATWGVVGMLIVIPFLGMFKILCKNVPRLHAVSYLLGSTGTEQHALSLDNIKKKWKKWFS